MFKARLPVLLLFRRLSTGNGICHRFSLTAAAMNKFGFVRYASSFYRNVRVSEQTRVKEITGSGMLSIHSTGSLTHAMVHPGILARTSCSGTLQGWRWDVGMTVAVVTALFSFHQHLSLDNNRDLDLEVNNLQHGHWGIITVDEVVVIFTMHTVHFILNIDKLRINSSLLSLFMVSWN